MLLLVMCPCSLYHWCSFHLLWCALWVVDSRCKVVVMWSHLTSCSTTCWISGSNLVIVHSDLISKIIQGWINQSRTHCAPDMHALCSMCRYVPCFCYQRTICHACKVIYRSSCWAMSCSTQIARHKLVTIVQITRKGNMNSPLVKNIWTAIAWQQGMHYISGCRL